MITIPMENSNSFVKLMVFIYIEYNLCCIERECNNVEGEILLKEQPIPWFLVNVKGT